MMKIKIENGIEYMLENDIWYPTFRTKENGIRLGKYGMMRKEFLAQNHQMLYNKMALSEDLYSHCKKIEDYANVWKNEIVKCCIAKGHNIRSAYDIADEIIIHDLILV